MFSFARTSLSAVEFAEPSINWVPRIRRPQPEIDISLSSFAEVKNDDLLSTPLVCLTVNLYLT
jgi:hypothetical protein